MVGDLAGIGDLQLFGGGGLGLQRKLPGKRAQLLAVRLPANCSDVEEYLLRGIDPGDVRWLEA